ncbi:hypothetical protein HK102_000613 [Quaeritorhiza haematococci]|nr:hypothetical protein HK102_000613 [Quaeritorhiza haematococci]
MSTMQKPRTEGGGHRQEGPLAGIKVLEFAGLAPAPFCGMVLADFGADVVRVDRCASGTTDVLGRGKRSLAINLKDPTARTLLLTKIIPQFDVLIDPFRPGVLERMGLGPADVERVNPRCIFARLTGYGQKGSYASMAGHDINYIALSGALSALGRHSENPIFPANLLGDFAGGGLLCVVGILMALIERRKSGKGQVVDTAMIDGAAYLSTFVYKMKHVGMWNESRGKNALDGGAHFYEVYRTKDGKHISVGAIEPQFYAFLLKGLGLDPSQYPDQLDSSSWPKMKQVFANIFATRTRDEWCKIFQGTDACVAPVLEMSPSGEEEANADAGEECVGEDVMRVSHNRDRHLLVKSEEGGQGHWEPAPAPRLSRTPSHFFGRDGEVRGSLTRQPAVGQHTVEILSENGLSKDEITKLISERVALHQLVESPSDEKIGRSKL